VSGPSPPQWHRMLDEIWNSGLKVCVDAIASNLEAYSTAARVLQEPQNRTDRRSGNRRQSDRAQRAGK
jgi:hypothetical protein